MTLQRLRAAGLVWPVALALPALALLVGLGTWQMQRKAWKEDLIAQIAARIHQPPVAFAELEKRPPASLEYARARVRGTFRHEGEQLLWEPDPRHATRRAGHRHRRGRRLAACADRAGDVQP
jgi:cytochrome oxidase assembly protein ShyY1